MRAAKLSERETIESEVGQSFFLGQQSDMNMIQYDSCPKCIQLMLTVPDVFDIRTTTEVLSGLVWVPDACGACSGALECLCICPVASQEVPFRSLLWCCSGILNAFNLWKWSSYLNPFIRLHTKKSNKHVLRQRERERDETVFIKSRRHDNINVHSLKYF